MVVVDRTDERTNEQTNGRKCARAKRERDVAPW